MNDVREWIIYLCIIMITISMITMLVTDSSIKKTLKIVSSLVIFSFLMSPLQALSSLKMNFPEFSSIENEIGDTSENAQILDEQILKISKDRVIHTISEVMSEQKINFSDIDLSMDIEQDRSIFINELLIYTDDIQNISKIENLISSEFNLKCTVIVQEDKTKDVIN